MAGLVIDASVAVKWFLDEDRSTTARSLLANRAGLLAPESILLEVYNAIWWAIRRGRAVPETLSTAERIVPRAISRLDPIAAHFVEAANLSRRLQHPIFDCVYIAMARASGSQLITADERLFRTARKASADAALL